MGKSSFFGPETISLHTGYQPEPSFGSRAVPVYQTTSYVFETVDDAAALFNIEKGGHIYSRMTNPTVSNEMGLSSFNQRNLCPTKELDLRLP